MAMRAALRRTAEPILASGSTVVLGVLALLLSEQESNRALGRRLRDGRHPRHALGAVRAARGTGDLRSRPVLAVRAPGRRRRPARAGLGPARRRRRAPARCRSPCSPRCCSAGLALGGLGIRTGLSETEQFRVKPEAVAGAETLARAFPAGTPSRRRAHHPVGGASRHRRRRGRPRRRLGASGRGRRGRSPRSTSCSTAEPGTAASDRAVEALRYAVAAVPGSAPPPVDGADPAEAPRRRRRRGHVRPDRGQRQVTCG